MSEQEIQEKRSSIRLSSDNEVVVSVPDREGKIVMERTVLTDVSIEGVSFVTRHYEYYYPGQPVMLKISVTEEEGETDITAVGRVIWLSDPDISTCGELIQPRIGVCLNQGDMSRLLHS